MLIEFYNKNLGTYAFQKDMQSLKNKHKSQMDTIASSPINTSVIIPCKNHSLEFRNCLAGVMNMQVNISFEIIVVDSSFDPDVLKLVEEFEGIKLVRSNEGLNAASARNLGVSVSSGQYLAFIDSDCVPDQHWLQVGIETLSKDLCLISGPVLDTYPPHPIALIDNLLQFVEFSQNREEGPLDYAPGCNLIVRKEIFDEVGGFPNHDIGEDVFFSNEIISLWPKKCRFIPRLLIYHKGRTKFHKMLKHQYNFGFHRGAHGWRITKIQQRLGANILLIPFVLLKRLSYIVRITVEFDSKRIFILLLLSPLVLSGLFTWAIGFFQGCVKSINKAKSRNN